MFLQNVALCRLECETIVLNKYFNPKKFLLSDIGLASFHRQHDQDPGVSGHRLGRRQGQSHARPDSRQVQMFSSDRKLSDGLVSVTASANHRIPRQESDIFYMIIPSVLT